ncbi:MAG TPA: adenylate/guanylate cyclase domain-containing protein [Nitrospiria bacterium]
MIRLIFEENGKSQVRPFSKLPVQLGRGVENDLVLSHATVSRNHARIEKDHEGFFLVDLQSRNGTQVNGLPVAKSRIHDGDEIGLGKMVIRFSEAVEGAVRIDESAAELGSETVVKSVTEMAAEAAAGKAKTGTSPSAIPPPGDTQDRGARIIEVLTGLADALIAIQPVKDVLKTVMDLVFSCLPADRGFLMLFESESGQLVPKLVKYRDEDKKTEELSISRTIAERVFNEKVAILTSDALTDERFDSEQSIVRHGIRSAMYAPLWNKGRVIGVISVDSPFLTGAFSQGDLDLFSALAKFSAVAIEQVRLNAKVRDEQSRRSRLERYFSPNVLDRISQAKDSTTGQLIDVQEKEATVMFSDLVGFTTLSENLQPQQVAALLNEYFTEMLDIVFAHDGTLDKYIGDCIMVIFGAPFEQRDHADRAVRCAIEMREKLREFNKRRTGQADLLTHIGINSGKVVAGDIGSHKRKEFTVIGDTVNLAARLQSELAGSNEIIIGEETRNRLNGNYSLDSRGTVRVKGKQKEVTAYEVLDGKTQVP